MHILFLTQVLPFPLDAGPKVRAYYVLRYLAQSHTVTLVSFVRPTDKPDAITHLRQICEAVYTTPMPRSKWLDATHLVRSVFTGKPFIIQRDWVPAILDLLALATTMHGPFDAVHADQLWMAPYALEAQRLSPAGHRPHVILDQHNAVYMIPRRLSQGERNPVKCSLLGHESRKLARHEVDVCRQFDRVVWVTEEDFNAVQTQAEQRGARVPNTAIIPICSDPELESALKRRPSARRLTFLGGLHYPPNAQGVLWFAEDVLPRVLAQAPDAVLTVIGRHPPEALYRLGIPSQNLDVTGYVDDPTPYLEETAAFVVPLLAGGGMRVKIVNAWTWGLPIVSTTVGAEGIDICNGKDILIADAPEHFARHIVQLLSDSERAANIAQAGRQAALEKYNWRTRYQAWDAVYNRGLLPANHSYEVN